MELLKSLSYPAFISWASACAGATIHFASGI